MLGLPVKAIQTAKQGKQVYSSLDSKSKSAVNIAMALGAIGALVLGYKMVSGMGDMFKSVTGQKWNEERKAEESKERADISNALRDQQENPSLSKMSAKNIANSMFQAFLNTQPDWSQNLWDEGTDEKAIYACLKLLKNSSDWLLVSMEYGMPRRRNLASELSYELNTGEMGKVREILSKIGVTI
jgi:hypothetical protein